MSPPKVPGCPGRTLRWVCARPGRWLTLTLLVWTLGHPATTSAWTRTQVRGAQAHLDMLDANTALVALRLRVHISGGWLSELELPGLPPSIVFEPEKPVTLVADSGEKYAPAMMLRRGVWRMTFATRHEAPWRGDYTLSLLYRQALESDPAEDALAQRARWVMPPWRMGMEDTRIWISGPPGMTSTTARVRADASAHHTQQLRGRVLISHHRTHLPRNTEWTVEFTVPTQPGGVAPASGTNIDNAAPKTAETNRTKAPSPLTAGGWLPWIVLLLALLKARSANALATLHRVTARPLVPWPSATPRCLLAVGLAGCAHLVWSSQPWLAAGLLTLIVLLAIDRAFSLPPAASLRWTANDARPMPPRLWARLRAMFALQRWLDATTPVGAVSLTGALMLMASAHHIAPAQGPALTLLAVLIAPLWLTSTRLHLPWRGARTARTLERWRARHQGTLEAYGVTPGSVLLCLDEVDRDRDARLPLALDQKVAGLGTLDLSLVTDASSLRKVVALVAQVDTDSAADAALQALALSVRRTHGADTMHLVPSRDIAIALAAIGAQAPAEKSASEPDRAAA